MSFDLHAFFLTKCIFMSVSILCSSHKENVAHGDDIWQQVMTHVVLEVNGWSRSEAQIFFHYP